MKLHVGSENHPLSPHACIRRHSREVTHLGSFRMTHPKNNGRRSSGPGSWAVIIIRAEGALWQYDCLHRNAQWLRDLPTGKSFGV